MTAAVVAPAVPESITSGSSNPVTGSLKATSKTMGEAFVGSACPAASSTVTVGDFVNERSTSNPGLPIWLTSSSAAEAGRVGSMGPIVVHAAIRAVRAHPLLELLCMVRSLVPTGLPQVRGLCAEIGLRGSIRAAGHVPLIQLNAGP